MILLGGWGNIKEDYNQIAYLLSKYCRNVIVIDYRGVGETGLGPDDNHDFYTCEQYADDIMDLIKKLFPEQKDIDIHAGLDIDDDDIESDDDMKSSEYDENDELSPKHQRKRKRKRKRENNPKPKDIKVELTKDPSSHFNKRKDKQMSKSRKVFIIGLSMGANVAMQCALHEDAKKYLRGIAVCSGHAGAYCLKKGPNFDGYGNQIVTGNALHYGYGEAQRKYIEYSHSEIYRSSLYNRCILRTFYSWRLSTHPYYCCNCSKYQDIQEKSRRMKSKEMKKNNKKRHSDSAPNAVRGVSKWFESKLSLNLRGGISDKHAIVEGIERQTDVAEEGFNVANMINKISIPTLIYYGSNDTIIDPHTADIIDNLIGNNSCKEEYENGGHNFWFENPTHFLSTIEEWMSAEEDYDIATGARSSVV